MFTSLGGSELMDCLTLIPPVELQALSLLRDLRASSTGGWFPTVPLDTLATVTEELIEYTAACAALVAKLEYLGPVILPTLEIPEWPL